MSNDLRRRLASASAVHAAKAVRGALPAFAASQDWVTTPSSAVLSANRAASELANTGMRILLIEDDQMIAKSLTTALRRDGMSVDWVGNCADGAEALAVGGHSMVLLDLGLAGGSGLELLKAGRANGNLTPVIIVTARDGVDDRIAGLDLGADDYVVKPFDPRELIARMRAVWRRRSGAASSLVESGDIRLDLATYELGYRGHTEALPAREFALIRALMERPGAILSRSQIEERLYGWGDDVESNAVDVLIYSIRKKFGKDIIRNVRGAGWMVLASSR